LAGFEVTLYGRFWVIPEVRSSPGASAGRVFRQLLTESVWLAARVDAMVVLRHE